MLNALRSKQPPKEALDDMGGMKALLEVIIAERNLTLLLVPAVLQPCNGLMQSVNRCNTLHSVYPSTLVMTSLAAGPRIHLSRCT